MHPTRLVTAGLTLAALAARPAELRAQQPQPWSWSALDSTARLRAPAALPGIAYLRRKLGQDAAAFVLATLARLPQPVDLRPLRALTAFEPAGEQRYWAARFDAGLAGFRPDTGLSGLVDAAVTLTRIRLAQRWGAAAFAGETYHPVRVSHPPRAIQVHFDYTGAERLLDYLERDSAGPDDRAAIIALPAWRVMLEHRGRRSITPERLAIYLDHAFRRDPLHQLYKWTNPTGFWNLAGVAQHAGEYRAVLATLRAGEENIAARVRDRVAQFMPPSATLDARVMFLFSRFADGWAAGPLLGVDLEHFGDDYEHLLRVITHESVHEAENELGLPLPDLAETIEDRQLLVAMREVYREGLASYVAPVGVTAAARPGRLGADFGAFDSTFTALYARHNVLRADTFMQSAVEGAGAFYRLGAYMAGVIDSVLGRRTLAETFRTGPVDFFARYVEACRARGAAIPGEARFRPAVVERLAALAHRYPVDVLRDVAHASEIRSPSAQQTALARLGDRYATGPGGTLFAVVASELLIRAGAYHVASTRLVRGLAFAPNREEIADAMAYRFLQANAPGEALTMYNLYISYAPESAAAYASRCGFYLGIGEVALAWGDCRQALRLDPDLPGVRRRLGEIEQRLGA